MLKKTQWHIKEMAEKEKCEDKNFKFKDDSEKMEKPGCSAGRIKV